jgi:signal transduction histidine kinase
MARVTLELRVAYERQKELDHLKDEFIMTASHELRTPLTAVQGYIELLSDFGQELPAETRNAFLKTVRHSVDELALMVGNIMNAGQVNSEAERASLNRLPLAEQVVQTAKMFEGVVQQEKRVLHIDIPASISVLADDFRLRQVMRNLIGNALKYSPPGTKVEISGEQSGEQVTVSIRDYGLGIPPKDQAYLFERFVRLERDLNSPVRGSGLGLYISKQLVEATGGRIWVESKGIPGQGSRFAFTLPSAPNSTEHGERKQAIVAGVDR